MARGISILICLGACLVLFIACPSGPSSSGPSSEQGEAAALERKAEHLEGLLAQRPLAGMILDELISALPDRAWLTEAVFGSGKVQVKGNASSNILLADYLSRLEASLSLTNVSLLSSSMKTVRGQELQQFALEASSRDAATAAAPPGSEPAARLEELRKALPAPQDSAETLRELQRLAVEVGLQMTGFAPGAEVPGEFTTEWPVAIELTGDWNGLGRYLQGFADLPRLWVVERFSFKAISGDGPRAEVRGQVTAVVHFLR